MSALQAALIPHETQEGVSLRDYQEECLSAILDAYARGTQRQLVVLPTGAGKTIVFAALIDRLLAASGGRALVLAHRDELIDQAAAKFRRVAGGRYTVGIVKAERDELDREVLVASIQTLARPRRLGRLPLDELAIVVADECHHTLAKTWRAVLHTCRCWDPAGPLLVGVTATPDRADGRAIGDSIFQALVYSKSILDLIEAGYLCDVEARTVRLEADLGAVHSRGGDLDAGELARVLLHANAPARVLEAYKEHAMGRKAIAFTPGVKLAHELAAAFRSAGIAAEAADGSTHPDVRRAILHRFARGETRVICNDSLWTEGFDEPSCDCIILARPTKSRPLFMQMLGRGLRTHPGKTNCLVLDLAGNAGKHDIASVPGVFGLPRREETGSVKEAARQQQAAAAAQERERARDMAGARLVARTVDLFRRGGSGPALHWVPVQHLTKTYMALYLGDGLLKVGPVAPESWAVVLNEPGQRPRVLAHGMAQHQAQRLAEEYARRHGKPWAVRAGLAWRSAPASRKTLVFARAKGIALPPRCTAGEASDAITRHKAIHGL